MYELKTQYWWGGIDITWHILNKIEPPFLNLHFDEIKVKTVWVIK